MKKAPKAQTFTQPQLEAIEHTEGPCRVLAGPGSGKTTVLTNRIVRLVETGSADTGRMLVTTFTTKAADEMAARIKKVLGHDLNTDWIGTMHSCFLRILRSEYGDQQVLESRDRRILLSREQKANDLAYTREIEQDELLDSFDRWRMEMVEPAVAIERITNKIHKRFPRVARNGLRPPKHLAPREQDDIIGLAMWQAAHLYEAVQRRKHVERMVDFADMIFKTWLLFRDNDRVRRKWANHFEFVSVDEFQDIDPCQWAVIRMLTQDHQNLFVVGDDDQSIYSFRGARPKLLIEFGRYYPGAKTIVLTQNFRCPANVVVHANQLIRHNKERAPKDLFSEKAEKDPFVLRPGSAEGEADEVVKRIKATLEGGSEPKDCAVLYRTHARSLPFETRLSEAGIPYIVRKGRCFYDIPDIETLVHYLEVAAGLWDDTTLQRIANKPNRYVANASLAAWRQKTSGSLDALLRVPGVPKHQDRALEKLWEDLSSISRRCAKIDGGTGEIVPIGVTSSILDEIDRVTGYRRWARSRRISSGRGDEDLEGTFQAFWRASAEHPSPSQFLRHIDATRAFARRKKRTKNAVTLSTFHGVKGLEFRHVFLTGMVENLIPHERAVTAEEVEEERRLAYVGFTRTKHSVTLTSPAGDGEPSRFVKELGLCLAATEKRASSSTLSDDPK